MSELGSHLSFPQVARERLIGNVELQKGAEMLGAELPSGEANNFICLAVERQPGEHDFRADQLRAVSVMTPSGHYSTAEVAITLSPGLNGERTKVEAELITRMARLATGKFAYLDVVEKHVNDDKKSGQKYTKVPLRTVKL